ncbi:MAG: HD domain-containing protein [Planctomycetes bacterium]|nr:HD domain-containing protein [Planctomycetota bacterium]
MAEDVQTAVSRETAEDALRSLLEVGAHLAGQADRRKVLDLILKEARRLARAEAGSLYVLREGRLRFVAAQNDRVPVGRLMQVFLDREMPASADSLAGYVASAGRTLNIPDAYALPPETPFRLNRDFDAATGYRTQSILALPLSGPDGETVGVLELFNRLGAGGRAEAFPEAESGAIQSLAAMASLAVHNMLLQERLKQAQLDTILRLSVAVEFRDSCTADHIRRMARTTRLIAHALGLPEQQVDLLECASPMHDIGKIGVPDAILLKPDPLTEAERDVIRRHPQMGADILGDPTNDLLAAAREIALAHHERWNGQGYPFGLAGERVPLSGRIVGLADVFDALISKRVYKDAYPLGRVLEIIRSERGGHFDPRVADAFLASMDAVRQVYHIAREAGG